MPVENNKQQKWHNNKLKDLRKNKQQKWNNNKTKDKKKQESKKRAKNNSKNIHNMHLWGKDVYQSTPTHQSTQTGAVQRQMKLFCSDQMPQDKQAGLKETRKSEEKMS